MLPLISDELLDSVIELSVNNSDISLMDAVELPGSIDPLVVESGDSELDRMLLVVDSLDSTDVLLETSDCSDDGFARELLSGVEYSVDDSLVVESLPVVGSLVVESLGVESLVVESSVVESSVVESSVVLSLAVVES